MQRDNVKKDTTELENKLMKAESFGDFAAEMENDFLPAEVSRDLQELISALAPMLATLLIGIVGYTGSKIPMASDELTMGIRLITIALFCGLPIIGWICTLFAMKKFSLTKEEMERIQIEIAEKKAEAQE